MKKEDKIIKDIKEVKIQGATDIAKKGIKIYTEHPTKKLRKRLMGVRPTEPLLFNSLDYLDKGMSYEEIMKHFFETQEKINKEVLKFINRNDVVFTHCHSSAVVNSLIYAKKRKEKFEVYNTETRPLFQGRKTAQKLKKAGIKVTSFVDSAMEIALERKQKSRKVSVVLLGADAILKKGVVNKVGSNVVAQVAFDNKIPVYILADSWKFYPKKIKIEERDFQEVWDTTRKLKIRNPAFELIEKKYIKGIISDLGVLKFGDFLKKVKHN